MMSETSGRSGSSLPFSVVMFWRQITDLFPPDWQRNVMPRMLYASKWIFVNIAADQNMPVAPVVSTRLAPYLHRVHSYHNHFNLKTVKLWVAVMQKSGRECGCVWPLLSVLIKIQPTLTEKMCVLCASSLLQTKLTFIVRPWPLVVIVVMMGAKTEDFYQLPFF